MKELSIEEKAKRYDESIEIAKKINNEQRAQPFDVMTRVFPELAESKDEKIKKEILSFLREGQPYYSPCSTKRQEWADWLEKQGKNNMGISEATKKELEDNLNRALEKETQKSWNEFLEKQGEQKPAVNAVSKFKVGDWLQYRNAKPFLVKEITRQGYVNGNDCLPFSWENEIHLWTIQDAKDGDVLAYKNDIVIFKDNYYNPEDKSGCMFVYCSCNDFYEIGGINLTDYKPATKEQRNILFAKMKEAGYEWDAEKKELKKIEQSSTWSEEDECMLNSVIATCELTEQDRDSSPARHLLEMQTNWLKLLKEKVQSQPKQEWSEKDERMVKCCKIALEFFEKLGKNTPGFPHENYFELDEKIYPREVNNWLKELKERYT